MSPTRLTALWHRVSSPQLPAGAQLAVRLVEVLGTESRQSPPKLKAAGRPPVPVLSPAARRKLHTVYQLRARVGPFESTSFRRFSEFLDLHKALQKAWTAATGNKPALVSVTPTAKKLFESKLSVRTVTNRSKQDAIRSVMIQRYCAELCASSELARNETVTGFFWPSGESGSGSVIAPDGSMASMT